MIPIVTSLQLWYIQCKVFQGIFFFFTFIKIKGPFAPLRMLQRIQTSMMPKKAWSMTMERGDTEGEQRLLYTS